MQLDSSKGQTEDPLMGKTVSQPVIHQTGAAWQEVKGHCTNREYRFYFLFFQTSVPSLCLGGGLFASGWSPAGGDMLAGGRARIGKAGGGGATPAPLH